MHITEIALELADESDDGDEVRRNLEKIGKFENHLRILQLRHAQLIITKYSGTVNPFGKIIWRE